MMSLTLSCFHPIPPLKNHQLEDVDTSLNSAKKPGCCSRFSFRKFLLTIVALYYFYLLAHHGIAVGVFGLACFGVDFNNPSVDSFVEVRKLGPLWEAVIASKGMREEWARMVRCFFFLGAYNSARTTRVFFFTNEDE